MDETVIKNEKAVEKKKPQHNMASESAKLLEEIVYIISHDLQVPLISIEGYAAELLESYKDKLDENGLYCLERLRANTRRMYQLVLSLLEISRLNTRKYPHETFDPAEITREIVRELALRKEIPKADIQVGEMPRMRGDKARLEGVFRRLITNAILYGGKHIVIGCRSGTWFVKDDGIGIPLDQLEKIFQSGQRLKRMEVEGVGMGLTYCKFVIHQHGGRLWVESDGENKGATFYFNLKT